MFADYYVEDLEEFNLRDFIECLEEDLNNREDEIKEDLRINISIYFIQLNKKIEEDVYLDEQDDIEDIIDELLTKLYRRIYDEVLWL